MRRVLIHTAVSGRKRQIAATMAGLSGDAREHGTALVAIAGGPSDQWDQAHGYDGKWYSASQCLAATIAQAMLVSGLMLQTESWYVAYWEGTDDLIDGDPQTIPFNTPVQPSDSSFEAFLVAIGCERVVPTGA